MKLWLRIINKNILYGGKSELLIPKIKHHCIWGVIDKIDIEYKISKLIVIIINYTFSV